MADSMPSLRERSKAKRRESIRRSAMRLFAERGYTGTTIADIAEAAEVAPRTVTMYFPSKVDIAMSVSEEVGERLHAAFREHPEHGFLEAIDRWLTEEAEYLDAELLGLSTVMVETNPDLASLSSAKLTEAIAAGRAVLLADSGLTPADPMAAILEAAVAAAISQFVNTGGMHSDDRPELQRRLISALRALIGAAADDVG